MSQSSNATTPRCIGQLLLYGGFINTHQLEEALAARGYQRLGHLLQQRQQISPQEKREVLKLQAKLKRAGLRLQGDGRLPGELQLSLGQLLLSHGAITEAQLDAALAEHQSKPSRLGEVLVAQKAITGERLQQWLQLQKKLVAAATAALLMSTYSATAAAGERAPQTFWGTVKAGNGSTYYTNNATLSWNQRKFAGLPRLTPAQENVEELARSRDGSMVLRVTDNGLEFKKFF